MQLVIEYIIPKFIEVWVRSGIHFPLGLDNGHMGI